MLHMASGRTAYLSQSTWDELDHTGKVLCLRLLADREWVQEEVNRIEEEAARAVERRWLNLDRNVTPDDLLLFGQERTSATDQARPAFWSTVKGLPGRCAHGASADGCRVRGCSHQWRPLPPPIDRYFKGALRQQILERDDYRCQYCGKTVRDDLPRDHYDKANIDHAVPYPGGPTTYENGKTACTVCNALKGADERFPVMVQLDDL
jgi:5-methylcytosine-specific restriction endonuclease McrA